MARMGGWNGCERLSLCDRGPADLVLALVLIHHLVFSKYVPLSHIAKWFASIGRYLIVGFIPPDDPMALKLLANRGDEHHPYSLEVFQSSFGEIFDLEDKLTLQNGRTLYLCKRKS